MLGKMSLPLKFIMMTIFIIIHKQCNVALNYLTLEVKNYYKISQFSSLMLVYVQHIH